MQRIVFRTLSRSLGLVWILMFVAAAYAVVLGGYKIATSSSHGNQTAEINLPYVPLSPDGQPSGLLPPGVIQAIPYGSDSALDAAAAERCQAEDQFLSVISKFTFRLNNLDSCEKASRDAAIEMYGNRSLDFLHAEAKHYSSLAMDPNVQKAFPYARPEDIRGYLVFVDGSFASSFSNVLMKQESMANQGLTNSKITLITMWAEATAICFLIFLGALTFMLLLRLDKYLGELASSAV
jgi:hypothetical protein